MMVGQIGSRLMQRQMILSSRALFVCRVLPAQVDAIFWTLMTLRLIARAVGWLAMLMVVSIAVTRSQDNQPPPMVRSRGSQVVEGCLPSLIPTLLSLYLPPRLNSSLL